MWKSHGRWVVSGFWFYSCICRRLQVSPVDAFRNLTGISVLNAHTSLTCFCCSRHEYWQGWIMWRYILTMKRQFQLCSQVPRMPVRILKARQKFSKKGVRSHSFWCQPDFSDGLYLSSTKQASKAAACHAQQIRTATCKITNCIWKPWHKLLTINAARTHYIQQICHLRQPSFYLRLVTEWILICSIQQGAFFYLPSTLLFIHMYSEGGLPWHGAKAGSMLVQPFGKPLSRAIARSGWEGDGRQWPFPYNGEVVGNCAWIPGSVWRTSWRQMWSTLLKS